MKMARKAAAQIQPVHTTSNTTIGFSRNRSIAIDAKGRRRAVKIRERTRIRPARPPLGRGSSSTVGRGFSSKCDNHGAKATNRKPVVPISRLL